MREGNLLANTARVFPARRATSKSFEIKEFNALRGSNIFHGFEWWRSKWFVTLTVLIVTESRLIATGCTTPSDEPKSRLGLWRGFPGNGPCWKSRSGLRCNIVCRLDRSNLWCASIDRSAWSVVRNENIRGFPCWTCKVRGGRSNGGRYIQYTPENGITNDLTCEISGNSEGGRDATGCRAGALCRLPAPALHRNGR